MKTDALILNPEEKVITTVRRHKYVLFIETGFLGVFVGLPPIIYMVLRKMSNGFIAAGDSGFYLFLFFYSFILIGAFISYFSILTNYFLDILIITNERLIDVEQKRFFHREISTMRVEHIQDVTISIKGFIASMLKFGELRIQSSGESREFIMRDIPNPEEVKNLIFKLHSQELDEPQEVKLTH